MWTCDFRGDVQGLSANGVVNHLNKYIVYLESVGEKQAHSLLSEVRDRMIQTVIHLEKQESAQVKFRGLLRAGLLTVNEVRGHKGYPPIDGPDFQKRFFPV